MSNTGCGVEAQLFGQWSSEVVEIWLDKMAHVPPLQACVPLTIDNPGPTLTA